MTCDDVYRKIASRQDMQDISIDVLIRVVVATFEEIITVDTEEFTHVDDI